MTRTDLRKNLYRRPLIVLVLLTIIYMSLPLTASARLGGGQSFSSGDSGKTGSSSTPSGGTASGSTASGSTASGSTASGSTSGHDFGYSTSDYNNGYFLGISDTTIGIVLILLIVFSKLIYRVGFSFREGYIVYYEKNGTRQSLKAGDPKRHSPFKVFTSIMKQSYETFKNYSRYS